LSKIKSQIYSFLLNKLTIQRIIHISVWVFAFVICIIFFETRRELVLNKYNIGHADTAAYALQGRALAETGSLKINYITNFYHQYDSTIKRYDDHWPPFQSMLYAPVFKIFGADAVVARHCNLFMGSVVLPLLVGFLIYLLTKSHWPILIGVCIILNDAFILRNSVGLMADLSLIVLTVAFITALVASKMHHMAWIVVAGLVAVFSYFCKGSQIMLLPFLILSCLVIHGKVILKKPWIYISILIFLTLITPRIIDNYKNHGKVFVSTQNYVASFFGLSTHPWGNWDEKFYGVYWDKELPKLEERFDDRDKFQSSLIGNTRVALGSIMLGTELVTRTNDALIHWYKLGKWGAYLGERLVDEELKKRNRSLVVTNKDVPFVNSISKWPNVHKTVFQMIGVILLFLSIFIYPIFLLYHLIKGKKQPGSLLVLSFVMAVFVFSQIIFVVGLWYAMPRLIAPFLPICICLAIAFIFLICRKFSFFITKLFLGKEKLAKKDSYFKYLRLIVLLCVWGLGYYGVTKIPDWHKKQVLANKIRINKEPKDSHYSRVAKTAKDVLPEDAIIMTRNPWELLFYFPEKTQAVGLPYAEPKVLFAIAKYYNVTHLMVERYRPGMREFLNKNHPALTEVMRYPQRTYEINYDLFAKDEIANVEDLQGYARKRK
jgi:hypothetical protein